MTSYFELFKHVSRATYVIAIQCRLSEAVFSPFKRSLYIVTQNPLTHTFDCHDTCHRNPFPRAIGKDGWFTVRGQGIEM